MKNICDGCEYGNRFIDLGKCPECETGRIVGDFHTREIFCSNLHKITTFAVDFCGCQNCRELFKKEYEITITARLSYQQLIDIGKYIHKSSVVIYQLMKNHSEFCEKMCFTELMKLCLYLQNQHISFQTKPDIPLLYKFDECFPDVFN